MNTPLVVGTLEDPELLKQFARASILHANLDNTLKMFVKSFHGTSIEEALHYIGYQGAASLRKRVVEPARGRSARGGIDHDGAERASVKGRVLPFVKTGLLAARHGSDPYRSARVVAVREGQLWPHLPGEARHGAALFEIWPAKALTGRTKGASAGSKTHDLEFELQQQTAEGLSRLMPTGDGDGVLVDHQSASSRWGQAPASWS